MTTPYVLGTHFCVSIMSQQSVFQACNKYENYRRTNVNMASPLSEACVKLRWGLQNSD
jgi:hypothetical protein